MTATTFEQFAGAINETAGWVASGVSAAAEEFSAWIAEESAQRVITETEKFNKLAETLGTEFRSIADRATTWAQAARTAGSSGIADIMDKYAARFASQADSLLN